MGRATVFLVGLAVILALVLGLASAALGADGKPFILGKGNVATKVSALTNRGLGAALSLNVQDGQPPLAVNSQTRVDNLNADQLDGRDSGQFVQAGPASAQNGSVHIDGMVRSGSETGTSQPPTAGYFNPDEYDGVVVRRVASTSAAAGQVIARTNNVRLERDGTNGGLRVAWDGASANNTIACTGINSSGAPVGEALNVGSTTAAQFPLFTDAENLVFVTCSFGYSFGGGHTTQVTMQRKSGDNYWVGSLTSTFNQ